MKVALIITSGRGSRLNPFTNEIPKSLISINGKHILESCLENLERIGIKIVFITHRQFNKNIIHKLKKNFPLLQLNFIVQNELFETGGAIFDAKLFFFIFLKCYLFMIILGD